MHYQDELPIKWCVDCETHFYAPPMIHSEVEHDEETFEFVRGTHRKVEHAEQGVVRAW